jgi:hypothetical protein
MNTCVICKLTVFHSLNQDRTSVITIFFKKKKKASMNSMLHTCLDFPKVRMDVLQSIMVDYELCPGGGQELVDKFSELISHMISVIVMVNYAICDVCSPEGKAVIENKLSELSFALLAAYDNGELLNALEEGHSGWQKCARTLENQ